MERVAIISKTNSGNNYNECSFLESFASVLIYKGRHYIERSPNYQFSIFNRENADYFMKKYGRVDHKIITLIEAKQILSNFKKK